ncbi:MAG: transcriptional repressor LexA [bacterium]|nr:transcriptional repressor LexA [bacterium]
MKDRTKLSERQRNILRFIESYIEQHGFPPTIRNIGAATGIESTSVVNYNLNKLVSAGYLARESRASRGLRLVKDANGKSGRRAQAVQPVTSTIQVSLAGPIAAGQPLPIPTDQVSDDLIDVLPSMLNGANPSDVFALRVKGDSMIDAMIGDGDIVLIRHAETARDGELVAVFLEDRSEVTLKYFYRDGDMVRLQPAHPTMQPIFVDPKVCHVQGRVLSVLRLTV